MENIKYKSYAQQIEEKINGASYNKLSIHEKINVKAHAACHQPFNWFDGMRVRNHNPYIYTGDFSRLPIKTGKGYNL